MLFFSGWDLWHAKPPASEVLIWFVFKSLSKLWQQLSLLANPMLSPLCLALVSTKLLALGGGWALPGSRSPLSCGVQGLSYTRCMLAATKRLVFQKHFWTFIQICSSSRQRQSTQLLLESVTPASLTAETMMAVEGIASDRCLNITRKAFSWLSRFGTNSYNQMT